MVPSHRSQCAARLMSPSAAMHCFSKSSNVVAVVDVTYVHRRRQSVAPPRSESTSMTVSEQQHHRVESLLLKKMSQCNHCITWYSLTWTIAVSQSVSQYHNFHSTSTHSYNDWIIRYKLVWMSRNSTTLYSHMKSANHANRMFRKMGCNVMTVRAKT